MLYSVRYTVYNYGDSVTILIIGTTSTNKVRVCILFKDIL